MIYLDNAASSPILPCAIEAFLKAPQGNPNSGHIAGMEARQALEKARDDIAECLDCSPSEIVFTSGATEACNLGVQNLVDNDRLIIEVNERSHHAVSEPCSLWNESYLTRWLSPKQIISRWAFPLVDGETGKRLFVRERMKKGKVFVDATAAVGHLPVSFARLGVDLLAFGGHKFGAPKGIGALIVKESGASSFDPMIIGGGQEEGRRAGTQPVPLICAMAAALKWQTDHMEENLARVKDLNKRMREILGEVEGFHPTIRKEDVGNIYKVSPYILSCRFDGVSATAMVAAASSKGVCISAGAACSTGKLEASPALLASGLTERQAMQTIRISFSFGNTFAEIDEAGKIIRECATALKSM